MNTCSLKFQLIVWYAVLLSAGTGLLGVGTYFVLGRSLMGALGENQARRARQIGLLLREEVERGRQSGAGDEVEARYAPGLNDRFRVDKARPRDRGGAGLGLSIVQSICSAHRGRVEVSSPPGQGSRFRVELPLSTAVPAHERQPAVPADTNP
jgi:hypothetical protein